MSSATPDNARQQGVELLRDRTAHLYTTVEGVLRKNLFDNTRQLASIRSLPTTSRQIVDTFLDSLDGKLQESEVAERMADLVRRGLGPRSALETVDHLSRVAMAILEADPEQIQALRPAIETHRIQFELNYVKAQVSETRIEQEHLYRSLNAMLEKQIALERRLQADLQQRQVQLQTAAEVARAASGILEQEQLFQQVIELIHQRFNLYYAGLFVVDRTGQWTGEPEQWAVLRAGTGEAGQKMLEQGHKLRIGGNSMIGWCVANGQARIALDIGDEAVRFDNPLLPETRSELALPLISRGEVIGALTIQSAQTAAFSEEDVVVFQTMADQLANAIVNARLFEQTRSALQEMEKAQRRYVQRAWEEYAVAQEAALGYLHSGGTTEVTTDAWLPAMSAALQQRNTIVAHNEPGGATLAIPLTLHGEIIGILGGYSPKADGWDEDEIAGVKAVVEQMALALENQRLFDEAQQATFLMSKQVKALDCLNDIGRKMDETPPVPEFLQWVTARIPLAMRHADVCRAAIEFEGRVYGAAEAVRLPCQMVQQMRIGGQAVGRVYVAYTQEYDFLDEESALLGDLTRRVSGYIENRRLFEQTQAVLRETETLYHVAQILAQVGDEKQMFEAVLLEYLRALDLPQGGLLLHDEDGRYGTLRALVQGGRPVEAGRKIPIVGNPPHEQLIRTQEPVVINDVFHSDLGQPVRDLAVELGYKSLLLVPIIVRGKVVGALGADSTAAIHEFTEREIALVRAVADQLGIALENRRLIEETRAALAETQALYRAAQSAAALGSLTDTLQVMVDTVAEALPARRVALYTLDLDRRRVIHFVRGGSEADQVDLITFDELQDGLSGWVLRHMTPALSPKGVPDPRESPQAQARRAQRHSGSICVAPVQYRGEVLGTLTAINSMDDPDFTQRQLDLLVGIANQAAMAIENRRLFEQTQAALAEVEATHRSYLRREWQDYLHQHEILQHSGFIYDLLQPDRPGAVAAIPDLWRPEMEQAITQRSTIIIQDEGDGGRAGLAIPITVRGETIGVLGVEAPAGERQWTEDDLALIAAVSDQLGQTLETARLFADTRRRAERERLIGEITAKIRASTDIAGILETTAAELGRVLGASRALVRLGEGPVPPASEAKTQAQITSGDKPVVAGEP